LGSRGSPEIDMVTLPSGLRPASGPLEATEKFGWHLLIPGKAIDPRTRTISEPMGPKMSSAHDAHKEAA
jgi:hypothetical protein